MQTDEINNVEQFIDVTVSFILRFYLLLQTLGSFHPLGPTAFHSEVEAAFHLLQQGDHFHYFFTDRDGTLKSNACSYPTSIQPAYSAVIQVDIFYDSFFYQLSWFFAHCSWKGSAFSFSNWWMNWIITSAQSKICGNFDSRPNSHVAVRSSVPSSQRLLSFTSAFSTWALFPKVCVIIWSVEELFFHFRLLCIWRFGRQGMVFQPGYAVQGRHNWRCRFDYAQ